MAGSWSRAGRTCCRPRALLGSLRLLNGAGVPAIAAHVAGLQARLLDALEGSTWAAEVSRLRGLLKAGRLGSFLAFHHGRAGADHLQALLQAGFHRGIFASVREGYLRVAFHGFHTEADVDRIAEWLNGAAS